MATICFTFPSPINVLVLALSVDPLALWGAGFKLKIYKYNNVVFCYLVSMSLPMTIMFYPAAGKIGWIVDRVQPYFYLIEEGIRV